MINKDTKLISFLKTFSRQEISEFEKFLRSPFFKKERDPLPLFIFLKKYYPEFPPEKVSDEIIIKELYPDADTSGKKSKDIVRNLSSSLLKAVTDFIFYTTVRNDVSLKNRIILKGLLDRNLAKFYEQYLTDSYGVIEKLKEDSATKALEYFHLEHLNTRYFAYTLDYQKFLGHGIASLEWNSANFILNLIWTAKIKYLEETYNNVKPENNFPDKLLEAINLEKVIETFKQHPNYPEISFSYYTYKSITNNNDLEYYKKAKEIFFKYRSGISRFEKNFFYADLTNILGSGIDWENEFKRKELFEITVSCVEDKAYKVSDEDFMHPAFYRNTIMYSTSARKFDWADDFIETFTGELQPEYRDNMKYYSKAVVTFGKGEFEKSLEYISKVKYDLTRLKVDVKILMLKIYYELNLEDPAHSLIDTFKHYASDSKEIAEETRSSIKNFVKCYSKLFKLKLNPDSYARNSLMIEIKKEKYLFHRDWLIEKLM